MKHQDRPTYSVGARGVSRRQMLAAATGGFGSLALHHMFDHDGRLAADTPSRQGAAAINPMAAQAAQFAPKATSVIFLFMYGGPSQVDTFDPKPALKQWEGKEIPVFKKKHAFFSETKATAMPSPYTFAKHGQAGIDISDRYPNLAQVADELCVIRSMHCESNNHGPALFQMNTGFIVPGHPSMGSWLTYGLGTVSQNLPGYVVLLDQRGAPVNGTLNWTSGFMPAAYQGVPFRPTGSPILNLGLAEGVSAKQQRARLALLQRWNERYAAANPGESELSARIASYELAFRMQMHAPDVVDLSKESEGTREAYGMENKTTQFFGRNCLLARRLVERGVRFVQVYSGGNQGPSAWDAHKDLKGNHDRQCAQTDQPIAALLTDLKARGLLDTTLVVWGGEFGRMPTHQGSNGRDHNPYGFTMWMAGGGVKPGTVYGASDEFGYAAMENKVHVHDLHATILHQLGIDHKKLTYRHLGRDFRLTDVAGNVVHDVLA